MKENKCKTAKGNLKEGNRKMKNRKFENVKVTSFKVIARDRGKTFKFYVYKFKFFGLKHRTKSKRTWEYFFLAD